MFRRVFAVERVKTNRLMHFGMCYSHTVYAQFCLICKAGLGPRMARCSRIICKIIILVRVRYEDRAIKLRLGRYESGRSRGMRELFAKRFNTAAI